MEKISLPDESLDPPQNCFRAPVAEVLAAAKYLDAAVDAHLLGNTALTEHLIRAADMAR